MYSLRGLGLVSDTPPCCGPFKLDERDGVCIDAVGSTPSFAVSAATMSSRTPTPYAGEPLDPNWMSCLRVIPGTEPVATDPSIIWGGNGAPVVSNPAPSGGTAAIAAGPSVNTPSPGQVASPVLPAVAAVGGALSTGIPTWVWIGLAGVAAFAMVSAGSGRRYGR